MDLDGLIVKTTSGRRSLSLHSLPGTFITEATKGTYRLCLSPVLIQETHRFLLSPRLCRTHGQSACTMS